MLTDHLSRQFTGDHKWLGNDTIIQNMLADHLSRQFTSDHKWLGNDTIIHNICSLVGLSKHRSLCHQRKQERSKVLLQRTESGIPIWFPALMDAYPPVPLISRIVRKLQHGQGSLGAQSWRRSPFNLQFKCVSGQDVISPGTSMVWILVILKCFVALSSSREEMFSRSKKHYLQ